MYIIFSETLKMRGGGISLESRDEGYKTRRKRGFVQNLFICSCVCKCKSLCTSAMASTSIENQVANLKVELAGRNISNVILERFAKIKAEELESMNSIESTIIQGNVVNDLKEDDFEQIYMEVKCEPKEEEEMAIEDGPEQEEMEAKCEPMEEEEEMAIEDHGNETEAADEKFKHYSRVLKKIGSADVETIQRYTQDILDISEREATVKIYGTQFSSEVIKDKKTWDSYSKAVRKLLRLCFTPKVLATHSMTGTPSRIAKTAVKPKLDSDITNDIIILVSLRCKQKPKIVRQAITSALADASKTSKRK